MCEKLWAKNTLRSLLIHVRSQNKRFFLLVAHNYCLLVVLLLTQFPGSESDMAMREGERERPNEKREFYLTHDLRRLWIIHYTLHRNDIIPCSQASHYTHNLIKMPDEIDVPIVHRLLFIAFNYSLLFLNYQCEFVKGFGKTCSMHAIPFPLMLNCNWCNTKCPRFSMINTNIVRMPIPVNSPLNLPFHNSLKSLAVWHNIIIHDGFTEPCVC